MAKVLKDTELADIVMRATSGFTLIECADAYKHFLEDLAQLVADHFGGEFIQIGNPDADLGWTASFYINECVPDDGGVFADYDTDVVWKDGKEIG